MTATTNERLDKFKGLYPARGTYGAAANTVGLKGTIALVDSDGNATPATTNAGLNAAGVYSATCDNRTTTIEGGAAGAKNAEISYGVFGFAFSGTTPKPGDTVFVVDNQTVSTDSNSSQRGIAGEVVEVIGTTAYVFMGPHVVGQIVIAAAVVEDVETAQSDIEALQADALSADAIVRIPLTSFVDADGDPLVKFVNGASGVGFTLADSEAMCLRWNNEATPIGVLCQVGLPPDLDGTAKMTLEFLCSKSGATVGDATVLTIGAYIISSGDLHDAGSNCGGDTGALVGDATAKTTAVIKRDIAAADIPDSGARSMTFTVTPKAGTLGTDDLMIHDVLLRYTRKLRTA